MHDAGGNPVTYNWTGSNMYVRSQELNADSFWTGSIAIKPVYTAGPHTVSYTYTGGVGSAVTYLAITEAT